MQSNDVPHFTDDNVNISQNAGQSDLEVNANNQCSDYNDILYKEE